MSTALRQRLGDDAAIDLIELLERERIATGERMMTLAGDRFERRLAEEIGAVRVELHSGLAGVRAELHSGLAAVRAEIATGRVEFIRWSFLFWVGQIALMAGLLSYMLRGR